MFDKKLEILNNKTTFMRKLSPNQAIYFARFCVQKNYDHAVQYPDSLQTLQNMFHEWIKECPNEAAGLNGDADANQSLSSFTSKDLDGAYFVGVFNTGGIDGLLREISRIKDTGDMPHELMIRYYRKPE